MSNKSGSKWIRPEKREAIYARDGQCCVYCGCPRSVAMMTLDHVTPRELGGTNDAANLVTACVRCNSSKRDLPLRRFLETLLDAGQDPEQVARRVRNQTRRTLRRN